MALSNSQYDAVMRRYEEIRSLKNEQRDERIRLLHARIPELKNLEDQAADLSVHAVHRLAADPSYSIETYRSKIADISRKKKELIRSAGFSETFTELQYECPLCKDTGFVNGRRCSCFVKIASEIIREQLGSLDGSENEDFSHFSLELYSDTIYDSTTGETQRAEAAIALKASKDLVRRLHDDPQNLLLTGNTGVGKTHLAHAIAREAVQNGASVLYFTAPQLFDHLSEVSFGRESGLKDRALINGADLLIIDDLGTELTNAFTLSELFRLIEERILKKRSTVISTNLSWSELKERYSERISSRIGSSYRILRLSGDDLRIRKALDAN